MFGTVGMARGGECGESVSGAKFQQQPSALLRRKEKRIRGWRGAALNLPAPSSFFYGTRQARVVVVLAQSCEERVEA